MSKYATKAAGNMFCQARYEAAKFNERLSSREGAAEELGVDRTRLARIELGSVTPYPEEVLLMADIYRAPELKGNYCREMCPLGKGMPKIESHQDIDRIALRALCSFRKINEAKEVLAYEVTKLVHGEEEANKAQAAAKALFVGGGDDANMPTTEITADKLTDGKIGILNLMVACGLAPSNKQARQLVEQGGVLVNDEKVPSAKFAVTEEMLKEGVKIRKGKKVFHKAVLA